MSLRVNMGNVTTFTGLLDLIDFEKFVFSSDFIFVMKVDDKKERSVSVFGEIVDLSKCPRCAVFDVPKTDSKIVVGREHGRIIWLDGAKVTVFFEYADNRYGFSTERNLLIGETSLVGEKRYPEKSYVIVEDSQRFIETEDFLRLRAERKAEKLAATTVYRRKIAEMEDFVPSSSRGLHIWCKVMLDKLIFSPYIKLAGSLYPDRNF